MLFALETFDQVVLYIYLQLQPEVFHYTFYPSYLEFCMLFSISIIARPPSALGFVVTVLAILLGLLSQKKWNKILSRVFYISADGDGCVDSR